MGDIPPKSNRKHPIRYSKHLYKARNLVERFFNKIKQFHRIATRFDKTPENFLAAVKLTSTRIWLGCNEFAAWAHDLDFLQAGRRSQHQTKQRPMHSWRR